MQKNEEIKFDYIWVIVSFLISLCIVFPYLHTGKIIAGSDWLFHASRVEEIYRNIKEGAFFTFISTRTFSHSGSGTFLFYPTVFFYPWILFRFLFSAVQSFYLWIALMTWVALLISYFSMKSFSKNSKVSFIFALLYVFNGYRIYLSFWPFGEFIASAFLPLVFLAFYRMFFDSSNCNGSFPSYLLMGVSMSLLIYSHLVSVFITLEVFVGILCIYALFGNLKVILKKWKEIILSILVATVLSLPIIWLFITNYIGKNISSTYFGINMNLVKPLSEILRNSFNSLSGWSLGLPLVIVFTIGWFYCRNNLNLMIIYLLGSLLLLISSSVFPWWLLKNSFLGVIQLPYRYLSYASLFLAIVGSIMLYQLMTKILMTNYQRNIALMFLIASILGLYAVAIEGSYKLARMSSPTTLSSKREFEKLPDLAILNNYNYNSQFDYLVPWGETDYYPKKSLSETGKTESIIKNEVYVNENNIGKISSRYFPNAIIYKTNNLKSGDLDLPCLAYHNTYVKANGKIINYKVSSRGTVLIDLDKYRAKKIEVGFKPAISYYISLIIAVFAWIIIFLISIKKHRI